MITSRYLDSNIPQCRLGRWKVGWRGQMCGLRGHFVALFDCTNSVGGTRRNELHFVGLHLWPNVGQNGLARLRTWPRHVDWADSRGDFPEEERVKLFLCAAPKFDQETKTNCPTNLLGKLASNKRWSRMRQKCTKIDVIWKYKTNIYQYIFLTCSSCTLPVQIKLKNSFFVAK